MKKSIERLIQIANYLFKSNVDTLPKSKQTLNPKNPLQHLKVKFVDDFFLTN